MVCDLLRRAATLWEAPSQCRTVTRPPKRARFKWLRFEPLESRQLLSVNPLLISEFMADNESVLQDGDGDYSDWIEIHNPSGLTVDLEGCYLTDDPEDLTKWEFPSVSLDPDDYLIVFASDKDANPPPDELHTNFKLDRDGEYLALVDSDGQTVVHEYAPVFPRQVDDISYGIGGTTQIGSTLVPEGAPARVLVPSDGGLGLTWTETGFNDSTWTSGYAGVGYDTGTGTQFEAKINFQPAASPVPAGYQKDSGLAFGDRGGGYFYGWTRFVDETRDRGIHPDQRYDTLNHLQKPGGPDTWEIAVPNGNYEIFGVFGDPQNTDQINTMDIEGTVVTDPDGQDNFDEYTLSVTVTDGRLTICPAAGSINSKIAFVDITSSAPPGYQELIGIDVEAQMLNQHPSAYIRQSFELADPVSFSSMTLRMKYDDGFVAYLNGVKIAERNAPASPGYNSTATDEHPDEQAFVFEDIDVSAYVEDLNQGANVLAIHGLNLSAGSDDFLILPELLADATITFAEQYFVEPTPGEPNVEGALGLVEDTQFSHDRGFYDEEIQVEITTDTAGVEIRYTLDGSPPTATTGSVYNGPIAIDSTTTLRAAAYKPGYIESNVDTQTYLFLDDVILQDGEGMPDTWGYSGGNLTSPPGPDYGVDPRIISQYSATILDDLKSVPTVSLVTDLDNWFGASNPEGIYIDSVSVPAPVSMEFFTADGAEEFQLDGSVQIQGGGAGGTSAERWKSYKLSMRLKFKEDNYSSEFGQFSGDPELRYPLYGEEGADTYDTLILDAQLNHTWVHPASDQRNTAKYIQDQVIADIQNGMGGWGPHGRFVHLYLNGQYWGMYTLHERPDEHFAAAYLGGDADDYDVLKHNSTLVVNSDPLDPSSAVDNYAELLTRVRRDMSNAGNYESVLEMLDVDAFIDYMMANFYAGNDDWAHKNWYASYNRVDPDGRWRFHSWDAEHVLESVSSNVTGKNDTGGPTEIHQRLKYNPEYRLRFADRVHKHMFNDGVLTPGGAAAVYQARMTEVDRAIVGESARWGDNRSPNDPYTRSDWLSTQNGMLASYFPNRSGNVLNQFRNQSDGRDLYPSVAAPEYRVNGTLRHGGEVEPTDAISMTGSGTIYYTLDGSDPRLTGGGVSGTAIQFTGSPIYLSESTLVNARVRSGSTWSALSEAQFYVGAAATDDNLVVTEINYNPQDPTPDERAAGFEHGYDFEFIELQNTSGAPIDLTTVKFTRGIDFDFTGSNVTKLNPGEYVVLVANPDGFAERYVTAGLKIAGQFGGKLDDNGEGLTLRDRYANAIFDFSYSDGGGWPGRADGKGASLELINPQQVPHQDPQRTDHLEDDANWHSSVRYGGTPGAAPAADLGVVVNEVLSHTDPPQKDTIELHNLTGAAINVGGWYLSDSWGWPWDEGNGDYKKFPIPDGTSIPAGGYLVFDEEEFNSSGGVDPNDFALSGSHGDDVWLMKADTSGNLTHFADHVEFGAAANGESLGRWPNGTGDLYPMLTPTLDKAHPENGLNSGPRVGPVLISEVHYNPDLSAEDDDLEFIEIFNSGFETVNLTNWRIRKGIDYDFPAGTLLESRGVLIIVPFELTDADKLTAFYDAYWPGEPVPQDLFMLGGYSGRLNDDGEQVQLQRPDAPPDDEPLFIPRLLEDEVRYDNEFPWPTDADGDGDSLNRAEIDAWGNTYLSWAPLLPTPGMTTLVVPQDGEVVGRYVFYNQSAFDGNDAAADARDDDAIATDKEALLPGGTATFANYTSCSAGINGIMIDVDGMLQSAVPTVDDFQFHVGNSDTPGIWAAAPGPSLITVRRGAGVDGSDRVTILWPDNAIQKQWLQVTVLTTDTTRLPEEDVFYFGNAIGDSGNSATDAKVNATDMLAARNNQRTFIDPAPVDFDFDFDRDARVNATDMLIARNNQTNFLTALNLVTVPPSKAGDEAAAVGTVSVQDAVFGKTAAADPGPAVSSPARLAWLYEFEQMSTTERSSRDDRPGKEAVEKVLATCWP